MVNVFPEPVTPSNVCAGTPSRTLRSVAQLLPADLQSACMRMLIQKFMLLFFFQKTIFGKIVEINKSNFKINPLLCTT